MLLIDSIQIFKKEKATSYPHGFSVYVNKYVIVDDGNDIIG